MTILLAIVMNVVGMFVYGYCGYYYFETKISWIKWFLFMFGSFIPLYMVCASIIMILYEMTSVILYLLTTIILLKMESKMLTILYDKLDGTSTFKGLSIKNCQIIENIKLKTLRKYCEKAEETPGSVDFYRK